MHASAATVAIFAGIGVAAFSQIDDDPTFRALGRVECWRAFQYFEVVLVRAVVNVHFRLVDLLAAASAILPAPFVPLVPVQGAQGKTRMVAVAAIACIRKELIGMFVVTNPVAAALGPDEIHGRPAEPATRDAVEDTLRLFQGRGCPLPCSSSYRFLLCRFLFGQRLRFGGGFLRFLFRSRVLFGAALGHRGDFLSWRGGEISRHFLGCRLRCLLATPSITAGTEEVCGERTFSQDREVVPRRLSSGGRFAHIRIFRTLWLPDGDL